MGFLETLFKSASRTIGREVGKKAVNAVVDMIDGDNKKKSSSAKKETSAAKRTTETPNMAASSPMAMASARGTSKYDTTPDIPVPFDTLNGWVCVKGATPQTVARALGLTNMQEANWASGVKAVKDNFMKKVFVTPMTNGYVLALGYIPFGIMRTVKEELSVLDKIADKFSEMSCFATQRTVDIHVWAKYEEGKLVRGYGWLGEAGTVYLNKGDLSLEEEKLGYTNLIQDADCDWEQFTVPDTEHVFAMAKEWGVAPDLSNVNGAEEGTGFVCDYKAY